MDEWQRVLAALAAAREAGQRFRTEVGRMRSQAGRISESAVRYGQQRSDFGPMREREAAAMRGDWHLLSEEGLSLRIGELRERALAEIAGHVETARAHRDRLAERTRATLDAAAPTGAEAVAVRVEAADASASVRRLLDAGQAPAEILARAVAIAHLPLVRALRRELDLVAPVPGVAADLDEAVARRAGFDPAPDRLAALRRALDDAELNMLSGDERRAREAQLQADRDWPTIEQQLDLASQQLDAGPTLADAVSARLAGVGATTSTGDDGGNDG